MGGFLIWVLVFWLFGGFGWIWGCVKIFVYWMLEVLMILVMGLFFLLCVMWSSWSVCRTVIKIV